MKLKSLGHPSQLIFTAFDGKIVDHGDHLAVHTLSNPNYFWGNLLIFNRPPRKGDYELWTQAFAKEFTDPKIYHITLAWDSIGGAVGDISEFLDRGYLLESTTVLAANDVILPPKFNKELEVRPINGAAEWDRVIEIQIASAHVHLSKSEWKSFYQQQSLQYQAMEKAGLGHWYGGYLNGELVASLGIFHGNKIGRFQTVSTDPKYQRQGFCQTLVYESSRQALASGHVETLVMCADPEYHAIKIYESVGFKRQQTDHGVYWWDKTRSSK